MTSTAQHHDTYPAAEARHSRAASPRHTGALGALQPVLRALVMAGTSSAAALCLVLGTRAALEPVRSGASVDLLVGAVVLAAGAAAAAFLAFGSITLLITHTLQAAGHAGRSMEALSDRCTPIALRRVVAVGLGAGLGLLGPVGMAGAAEPDLGWTVTSVSATESTAATPAAETVLPRPPQASLATVTAPRPNATVPVTSSAPAAPSTAGTSASDVNPATSAGPETIIVRAGDSLWSITAAHLESASPAEIAALWPHWYAANHGVIGEDPGIIRPGQTLVAPSAGEGDA